MGDKSGGPFHRQPLDKRLVKQVTMGDRVPDHWTQMKVMEKDCKIMEVRKFSSNYFELDAKFRRPGLELITAYAVQNPFLWGQYLLRREQMKMQLTNTGFTVKERDFFYKPDFENFEKICRSGFDPRFEIDPSTGVPYFTDSLAANTSRIDNQNVRLIIRAKVLVGTCVRRADHEGAAARVKHPAFSMDAKTGLPIDTFTEETKTVFFKFNMTEVYPDYLLIYRDLSLGPDTRTTMLPIQFCQLSYRTGTRFNPQEKCQITDGKDADEDPDKIDKAGVFSEGDLVTADLKNTTDVVITKTTASQPIKKRRSNFKMHVPSFLLKKTSNGNIEGDIEMGAKEKMLEE